MPIVPASRLTLPGVFAVSIIAWSTGSTNVSVGPPSQWAGGLLQPIPASSTSIGKAAPRYVVRGDLLGDGFTNTPGGVPGLAAGRRQCGGVQLDQPPLGQQLNELYHIG